jgi:hypothetical protein
MARQFVIECDPDRQEIWVFEVTKDYGDQRVNYHRNSDDRSVVHSFLNPKFHEQLAELLVTGVKPEVANVE